jgi:putative transposase
MRLFEDVQDYATFVRCVAEALSIVPVEIFAFCIMPNHFHLVVRPAKDPDLSHFMKLMTMRHSKRWHRRRESTGGGAVYQGRFRASPIETDRYFFAACRYVEANPLRAGLVERAEDWRWSSLHQRVKNCNILPLATWPILQPADWPELVNAAQKAREIRQLRESTRANLPFGTPEWVTRTAALLGREPGLHRPGPRPEVGS